MRRNCLTFPKSNFVASEEALLKLLVTLNSDFLIFNDSYLITITILPTILAEISKMKILYKNKFS